MPAAGESQPHPRQREVLQPPARPQLAVAGDDAAEDDARTLLIDGGAAVAARLLDNVETVVRGKRREIKLVLAALACGGHVLFEDVPGTAKTVLARALAQSVEGALPARIQCTPDLQPGDVTGLAVFDQKTHDFDFRPGPVFAN